MLPVAPAFRQALLVATVEMKVSWAESHGRKNISDFEVCRGEGDVWMDDGLRDDIGFRSGYGPYGKSHVFLGVVC